MRFVLLFFIAMSLPSCDTEGENHKNSVHKIDEHKVDIQIDKIFKFYDKNHDGYLTIDEYKNIKTLGNLNNNDRLLYLSESFKAFDLNCKGKITKENVRNSIIFHIVPSCKNP